MLRRWLFPLAAVSEILDFNNKTIPSVNHFQITNDTSDSIWPWRSYKSSPHHPPYMNITRNGGELSPGYVFLTPTNARGQNGTYELSGTGFIMTTDGDMIFAAEERGYSYCDEWVAGMADFRTQTYNGRPHITYWNGCNTKHLHWGHRWGRVTFIDEEYTNFTVNPDFNINTLDPVNKGQIDVHEHEMTDDNTMVVTSYNNTQVDLTLIGGSNDSWVAEAMFFEFDIETGEVLFQWSALDHTPLDASRFSLSGRAGSKHVPWDWFHINSVQKIGKNYLISSRHHWAIYFISGEDGSVIWKLDGENGGSFGWMPSRFRYQHHVRAHDVTENGMIISLFNNNVDGKRDWYTQTQAMAYHIPMPASVFHPPILIRELQNNYDMIWAATQGSYQMDLGNGNGFVGYGKVPILREFGPAEDGNDLRWQAWFGHEGSVMSYRAFKSEWHGIPRDWDPIAVFEPPLSPSTEPAKVFVSWNGATDISHWAVYAGDDRENLSSVGVVKKMGFETTFELDTAQCVQLGAIHDGKIIRASNIACQDDSRPAGQNGKPGTEESEHDLAELEAGSWFSFRAIVVVAISSIIIAAAIYSYRYWHERRRRKVFHGVLGTESYYKHTRLHSGLDLPLSNLRRMKHKISHMASRDTAVFDESKFTEAAGSGRRHRDVDDAPFGLAEEDEDEDEEDDENSGTNSLPPFTRATNAR